MIDERIEYRTYFLGIPYTLNIGCSQCSETAVQILVCETEKCLEVVETQCEEHRSVE